MTAIIDEDLNIFCQKLQDILKPAIVTIAHGNVNLIIREGQIVGFLTKNDDEYQISDGGELMALVSNDGYFIPETIEQSQTYIKENLPNGILIRFREFDIHLNTDRFDIEKITDKWKEYKQAYELVWSLSPFYEK